MERRFPSPTLPYLWQQPRTVVSRAARTILLLLALASSGAWANAACSSLSGTGTVSDPYLVGSVADIAFISNTDACIQGGYHFTQTANIDFQDATWTSGIGEYDRTSFTGTYDGGGHQLTNLTILGSSEGLGFFDATQDATIRSLDLVDVTVTTSNRRVGGLIGYADDDTVISDVDVQATVTGDYSVGGIIGYATGSGTVSIANATFSGSVTGTPASSDSGTSYVGGLLGQANGIDVTITYTTVEGATITLSGVDGDSNDDGGLGGLIGAANPSIVIRHVTVSDTTISSNDDAFEVGGFVGEGSVCSSCSGFPASTTVEHSTFHGTIAGGFDVGGINGGANAFTGHDITVMGTITANDEDSDNVGGLLGSADTVSISDVTVTANITARNHYDVGGLIGDANGGIVANSSYTGALIGMGRTGGLIGVADDMTISASDAHGSVEGLDNVGGLVGEADTVEIHDAHATNSVQGRNAVGGLVGTSDNSRIERSYATGTVQGTASIGGLVGALEGDASGFNALTTSYATGTVTGTSNVGGLVGLADTFDNITTSFATGSTVGSTSVGGLLGSLQAGFIQNTYATASVTGGSDVGGLIGVVASGAGVQYSFAAGEVSGTDTSVGGLVGTSSGNVSNPNTFWDVTTTQQAESDGGSGLSTEAMQTFATYDDANWTIVAEAEPEEFIFAEGGESIIWVLCSDGVADAYPVLVWQEDRASCEASSTEITAPTDLVVIPGNQKIWLIFTKSEGPVAKYQYRIDDGAWTDIPADVELPYLIGERPNGVEVTVTVRAVDGEDAASDAADASTATPSIIGEPEAVIGIEERDTLIELPARNGKGQFTMTFTFRNDGTETLTNLWIEENDLAPNGRITQLQDPEGNVLPQYGDRWYWQDVDLAPGATIEGTLTLEIEE